MATEEMVKTTQIHASYADGKLLIFAQGEMPDTCITAIRIVRSKLAVEPPRFAILRTLEEGQGCGDAMTSWTHFDIFEIGPFRQAIEVEDSQGVHEIAVAWFEPLGQKSAGSARAAGGGGDVPVPFSLGNGLKAKIGIAESVGYSNSFNFEEALQDALNNLPDKGPRYPDQLESYIVTNVSVELGGIAGLRRLRVDLRGGGSL